MKYSILKTITATGAITLILGSAPAWTGRVPDNMISGTVSAVSGNQIVVDGKSYSVKVDAPGLRELQQVQVGQVVELVFNGKPGSSNVQVIGIHVHEGNH